MNSQPLSEFNLTPGNYGWSGQFPSGPHRLFGKDITLEIHTRLTPKDPKVLPPVSKKQAGLVRSITSALPTIISRVESELIGYNQKFDPNFFESVRHPHVWLNCESDDGVSWTFVVGRTDNPDFGYDLIFSGTDFVELFGGD